MKVRIYTYPRQDEDENGDPIGRTPRRTQRTYSKLTPIQAARLLVAQGLGLNRWRDGQLDNEGSTKCWENNEPFCYAEVWKD